MTCGYGGDGDEHEKCCICYGSRIVRNPLGLEVECFRCKRERERDETMICKCKHAIKEINNRFRHARIARGSELLTMSCLEGDCRCENAEPEDFAKAEALEKNSRHYPKHTITRISLEKIRKKHSGSEPTYIEEYSQEGCCAHCR